MRQENDKSSRNRDSGPGPYNPSIYDINVLNDALGLPSNSGTRDIADSLSALLKRAKTLALGGLADTCLTKIENAYLPPKAGELAFSAGIRVPSEKDLTEIVNMTRVLNSLVNNFKPVPLQVSPAPKDGQSLCFPPVPLLELPLNSDILQKKALEFLKQEGILYPEAKKDVPPDPALLNKHNLKWKWCKERSSWEPVTMSGQTSLLRGNFYYFEKYITPENYKRTPECLRFIRDLTGILNKAEVLQDARLGAGFVPQFEKYRRAALYRLCAATRE